MPVNLLQPVETKDNKTESFIISIFNELEKYQICYCVLRNYEKLPSDHGNDLDILVKKSDFKNVIIYIKRLVEKHKWRILAEVKPFGIHKLYLLTKDFKDILIIDLFNQISWKAMSTAFSKYILENKIQYNNIWVASKGCDGAVTIVKELLMFGKIKKRNNALEHIHNCATIDKQNFIACLKPCFGHDLAKWMQLQTANENWFLIERKYKYLRWAVLWRGFLHNPISQIIKWYDFLWRHILHRIKKPMGFFVVLLGPDGSGKTTIAQNLARYWKESFSKGTIHIHGDFKLLPRLKNIRLLWYRIRRKPPKPEIDFTLPHSDALVQPHSLIISVLYISYYIWDYIFGRFTLFWWKSRDKLVLADRYFYDYYFQLVNSKLPHWFLNILIKLIPKPDLVVYLEREPETIYAQKNELTSQEIIRQQEIIRKIICMLPNAVTVNGDEGIEITLRDITKNIFLTLSQRNR